MQKGIDQTTTMTPQNPIQETASNKTKTHFPEPQNPLSLQNSPESKKSKPDHEQAQKSNGTASESLELNKRKEEEKDKATIPSKINETVEDSNSSGRERLKRHRVEVAGQVWIPDMWGQEDFLKDWIDCAAFDASLVNSSIMLARDSLVEEARRASSTRLRIENGC